MNHTGHKCYRCSPFDQSAGGGELSNLDSYDATFSEDGAEVFFVSGYSAREIAQKRAREQNARVFVNNVSRAIKRPDLSVPVAYAVSRSPVYTVRKPDSWHGTIYKAYWPPLV